MEGGKVLAQKIKKEFEKPVDIAIKYYSILSLLNNLKLTDRQIELLAHTVTRGTISTVASKNEFIKLFPGSTIAVINNLISALRKRGFLVKDDKMLRVHPAISLNFNKVDEFILKITCTLQKELTIK